MHASAALSVRAMLALILSSALPASSTSGASPDWIQAMKTVHARFHGTKGTLAQFGDSITITMAYWAPLASDPGEMSSEMAQAYRRVKTYMQSDCWGKWKGPEFGNNGSMTIRWAYDNVDPWLKKLNPEAVVIMFGSNDVGVMDLPEYETRLDDVVRRCLTNGTIVLLTTMPPRSGRLEKSRQFAEAARRIAQKQKLPLIDYFAEILKRRPEDWDGSLPQCTSAPGDEYQVPTLIARDGVHPSNPKPYANTYSEAALVTTASACAII